MERRCLITLLATSRTHRAVSAIYHDRIDPGVDCLFGASLASFAFTDHKHIPVNFQVMQDLVEHGEI